MRKGDTTKIDAWQSGNASYLYGHIWENKNVSKLIKIRITKPMVFPVVLYGCQTWTKTKALEKKIDACKEWIWRRMLKNAWTERRTNESILQEIGEMREGLSLLERATRQKMMRFEHVMRTNGLEKEMMLSCGDGRRRRG